ncbi:hypothetical protein C7Y69_00025 [Alteromonas sp. KS69]|uniref:Uncharacterized protein n=1 Tax=Alteromonas naphthalenivorans TaxID=715451 RepID=F5ZB18_ALTNA|nr:hypothetical protein ambt_04515 [Alteromonas naphthalenivorans]RUP83772.1 hypothetical protein C7Y69_00025 [Alteromonas sp. KS69]
MAVLVASVEFIVDVASCANVEKESSTAKKKQWFKQYFTILIYRLHFYSLQKLNIKYATFSSA